MDQPVVAEVILHVNLLDEVVPVVLVGVVVVLHLLSTSDTVSTMSIDFVDYSEVLLVTKTSKDYPIQGVAVVVRWVYQTSLVDLSTAQSTCLQQHLRDIQGILAMDRPFLMVDQAVELD